MRVDRFWVAAACVMMLASLAAAQRPPADGAPRIEKITPEFLETSDTPTSIAIAGSGFARRAEVRIRTRGDRGTGVDYPAVVESPALLKLEVPKDLLAKPATLELRVKNPDGITSEWVPLEVRARTGGGGGPVTVGGPVLDRISPTRIEARSRNVFVTIYGRGLVDGASVEWKAGNTTATSRGQLVNGSLTARVPDEILARPQAATLRVRGTTGVLSDAARVEIVEPGATPGGGGDPADPFVSRIDPQRVDMRGARSQKVELIGQGIDREGAKVLLRAEGSGDAGAVVPVTLRTSASNGTVLGVDLTPNMVRRSGTYELRVVNPNGRQSNWVRLDVLNADPGTGGTSATVDVRIPRTVTLTNVTTTVPVEVRVRNSGGSAVRLSSFATVTSDGTRVAAPGTLDVPAGAERSLRVEAPVSLAVGAASKAPVSYPLALVYEIGPASGGAKSEQRFPESGFETVAIRNEIPLVAIGRELVRDPQVGNVEGWRFFKVDNPANEDAGRAADFRLFAEPFTASGGRASEELFNYRPDPTVAADRDVFYLVLRIGEVDQRDRRGRERGTRLGYVAVEQGPGLVPLYRWERVEGRRTINHFLSTSKELTALPRQLQQQPGWRLDTVVGYVVGR
jgi:hypothetical protein